MGVGVAHLFFHLYGVGVDLGADAGAAGLCGQLEAVGSFGSAEVDEEQLGARLCLLGVEVELVEHVVDAVGAERDAYAAQAGQTEDARQVVVASAAGDGADLHVEGFHLEDAAGIVVQSASQGEVELDGIVQPHVLELAEHEVALVNALEAGFALGQHLAHGGQLVGIAALQVDDGLQLLYGLLAQAYGAQLFVDLVDTDFVEFVNGHRDVYNLVGLADNLGNTAENLAVVDFDAYPDAEAAEYGVYNLHQLHLVEQ
ncbi:unknown [Prevotella sp. CAG:617]|nr:unknown [Prevotella sp. CAG:617]